MVERLPRAAVPVEPLLSAVLAALSPLVLEEVVVEAAVVVAGQGYNQLVSEAG
jgi:hypothetical protein